MASAADTNYNREKSSLEFILTESKSILSKVSAASLGVASDSDMGRRLRQMGEFAEETILKTEASLSALETNREASLVKLNGGSTIGESAVMFAEKSRYIDSGNGYTSQHGQQYGAEHGTNVLLLATKCSTKSYNNGTEISGSYAHWHSRPRLIDTTAEKGDVGIVSYESTTHDDGNSRSYGPTVDAFIALRNNTNEDITVPLKMMGSSYTSYSGLAINMFTPDATNNANVTSVSFTNLANYTSNATTTRTANALVPANTTVIIHFSAARRYHDGSTGFYNYHTQLQIMNWESMFPEGITCDKQVQKNLDINRGYAISSIEDNGSLDGIWNSFEPVE